MNAARRESLRRQASFVACGAAGFGLYCVLSLLLVRIPGVVPEAAAFAAVLLSIPPVFWLQKRITFRHRGPALPAFARYCALQAFNALAITALAAVGRRAGLPDAANLVAAGAIVVVTSYLVMSLAVFGRGTGA